ncbi:Hsp20/alpha crystallin family protein [bacterium]|nr:Hsp20/alpha crystallin family protein [bacterium]
MIRNLMTLQDRMNRLFDEAFPARQRSLGEEQDFFAGEWTPAVDIYEDENAITLKVDIPGIDPNNLDIRVEGNTLHMKGERKHEKETKRENFYRIERAYGSFARSFTLPHNVQADRIDAAYKNGELKIMLPKTEEARPKQIKIKAETQESRNPETRNR